MRTRPLLSFLTRFHLKSRDVYVILVIAIVVMASMVVVLRGKSPQKTVLEISGMNKIESSYYVKLSDPIWQDSLTNGSQWFLDYQKNATSASLTANGSLQLNASFSSQPYSQALRLSRTIDLPLSMNPVLIVTLAASVGIHYGIRVLGQNTLGTTFQAWSEADYLQHRRGLGQPENFTIDLSVQAYEASGVLPASGSIITSLVLYMETTPGQTGQFFLNLTRLTAVSLSQHSFDVANPVSDNMNGIVLALNTTNTRGYTDAQFFQGFVNYYVSGTSNLVYTVYFLHDLKVLGQGFDYPSGARTYEIAFFSVGQVRNFPPFLPTGNNTLSIVLAPKTGSFQSFQLEDFSVRYISQSTLITTPIELDANALFTYYILFLFVTPVVIVILVSRLFSREAKQAS